MGRGVGGEYAARSPRFPGTFVSYAHTKKGDVDIVNVPLCCERQNLLGGCKCDFLCHDVVDHDEALANIGIGFLHDLEPTTLVRAQA